MLTKSAWTALYIAAYDVDRALCARLDQDYGEPRLRNQNPSRAIDGIRGRLFSEISSRERSLTQKVRDSRC